MVLNTKFLRESNITRHGIYLETSILNPAKRDQVLEIFDSDINESFTISYCKENLPMELVEYMIAKAKAALPPDRDS
jgi:hypothetical protein